VVVDELQLANSGNPNSPGWQSPEMLAGKTYGETSDLNISYLRSQIRLQIF
jgi:hypothetical protein